jgi:hypothetical protein
MKAPLVMIYRFMERAWRTKRLEAFTKATKKIKVVQKFK